METGSQGLSAGMEEEEESRPVGPQVTVQCRAQCELRFTSSSPSDGRGDSALLAGVSKCDLLV